MKADSADVYGVLSMVIWAITLVVTIRFVTFIMKADNDGEGGILSLVALVRRLNLNRRTNATLVILGLLGVSLFYGDAMLTPAISVLSAVEGVEVAAPGLSHFVVPVALALLIGLFMLQRHGTHIVGRLFGPVIVVWFAAIAAAGLAQLIQSPDILRAISPTYAIDFWVRHPIIAFISLGSVVLTVTGAEALYADMGHFGRIPIRRGWLFVVFPALALNYLGQGSLILENPKAISNPFYLLIPDWAQIPMILLATVSTLIASQAVISGAFSVTRTAVQLGFLPRLAVRHTSTEEIGQVYVPAVNWTLLAAVVSLVVLFGASSKLTVAYGVAVSGTLAVDSLLFLVIARKRWHTKRRWIALGGVAFLGVDLMFLAANSPKVASGGWLPLLTGGLIFFVFMAWIDGSRRVMVERTKIEGPLLPFIEWLGRRRATIPRVQGAAIYLSPPRDLATAPIALRSTIEHMRVLHQTVVIASVVTTTTPYVPEEERLSIDDLGDDTDGISAITLRFGFHESPNVTRALGAHQAELQAAGIKLHPYLASYFLSNLGVTAAPGRGVGRLRRGLFSAMARNANSPAEHFSLPPDRVVVLGAKVTI